MLIAGQVFILQRVTGQDSLRLIQTDNSIDITGQWFLAYQNVYQAGEHSNQYILRRGYVTFGKKFNDLISVRFTQDITTDREGSDAGNIEMRLKYLYIRFSPLMIPGLANSYLDFGMVSRPWLDFEEKVDRYRLQGTMYTERVNLMNSADFGLTYTTLLGGRMDKEYVKRVKDAYPGRYGSLAVGVYNGGGYYALEKNNNKTLEGRLSLRPLHSLLPGLQMSYGIALGKGNIEVEPDWKLHQVALSYINPWFRTMFQYVTGEGNSGGTFIDESLVSSDIKGYSLFGELQFARHFSLIGRYDTFSIGAGTGWQDTERYIGGLCYHFLNGQKILLDVDVFDPEGERVSVYEIVTEIRF
jgi:hypothetical protein